MNEQDKPLGTPNLHADTPIDQAPTPQKTKRKLNWKGFFIGIAAVIVIEFFAVSMLNSPDPEIPIQPPNASPTPTKTAAVPTVVKNEVASITSRGGMCQQGKSCESTVAVFENGLVTRDGAETKKLTHEQIAELKGLIAVTDFTSIKSKKFAGTCPIAYDGQEQVYRFTTEKKIEELPGCTYELDMDATPLFKFVNSVIIN